MKRYLNDKYIVIESEKDLTGSKVVWSDKNGVRLNNIGVINNKGDFTNFPQFYKYSEPWDPHSCPEYCPVRRGEILESIDEEIKYWEEKKAEFNKDFGWESI